MESSGLEHCDFFGTLQRKYNKNIVFLEFFFAWGIRSDITEVQRPTAMHRLFYI